MLRLYYLILLCVFGVLPVKAQYISVTENFTDQQLVEKILSNNSCVTPQNIKINGYTFPDGSKSYGYFTNSNLVFKLTEGILITTGKAKSAVGPNTSLLSEGPRSWAGDQDLEVAINERNTFNATSIEFEIDAVSSQFSFDYIFSSEQYLSNPARYQCDYSDGFAFLIKEVGNPNAEYENIALIPNTDIPIKIPNVRAATKNCPESHSEFFGGFNGPDHPTNYNGQTVVLTAKANVTPGKKYAFKLVVADQGNELYDSAIFLSAGSFKNSIDLGVASKVKVCQNESLFITPTPLPEAKYYTWFKDGIPLANYTQVASPNIKIDDGGIYSLEAFISSNCIITEQIEVTYKPGVTIANEVHEICQFSPNAKPFNIIANNNLGFNTHRYDYLSFHYTAEDAAAGIKAIPRATLENFLVPNGTTVLYTNGYDYLADCNATGTYTLIRNHITQQLNTQNICAPTDQLFDLTPFLPHPGATPIKIFDNENDADANTNPINIANTAQVNIKPNTNTFYIIYNNATTCGERYVLEINVLDTNLPDEIIRFCDGDTLQITAPNNYKSYSWSTNETTQTISTSQEGTYDLLLTDANHCEFHKRYIVIKEAKPTSFNQTTTLCTFIPNGEKQLQIKEYLKKYIANGNDLLVFANANHLNQNIQPLETVVLKQASTTFYIKEINPAGCYAISEVTIEISPPDQFPTELFCQYNNQDIDISELINTLHQNYPNKKIKIYTNFTDAENEVNSIDTNSIANSIQNLYISIRENNGNCFQSLIFPIEIDAVIDLETEVKTLCRNEEILLTAPTGNYTYLWNTGQTSQNITVNTIGQYAVTITNKNGCSFKKTYHVNQSEPAQIKDIVINQFANIQNSVTVILAGNGEYEFSLNGIDFQKSNIFRLVKAGEYTVYVKDPKGCGTTTRSILVLDIPNFFTPNFDGINDTWNVANLYTVFPDAEIYILDRFGKLIAFLNAAKPEWDGTASGVQQPSTDYWYVIKLRNGNTYKGHFSLKR